VAVDGDAPEGAAARADGGVPAVRAERERARVDRRVVRALPALDDQHPHVLVGPDEREAVVARGERVEGDRRVVGLEPPRVVGAGFGQDVAEFVARRPVPRAAVAGLGVQVVNDRERAQVLAVPRPADRDGAAAVGAEDALAGELPHHRPRGRHDGRALGGDANDVAVGREGRVADEVRAESRDGSAVDHQRPAAGGAGEQVLAVPGGERQRRERVAVLGRVLAVDARDLPVVRRGHVCPPPAVGADD
jgi:hypothetical protein